MRKRVHEFWLATSHGTAYVDLHDADDAMRADLLPALTRHALRQPRCPTFKLVVRRSQHGQHLDVLPPGRSRDGLYLDSTALLCDFARACGWELCRGAFVVQRKRLLAIGGHAAVEIGGALAALGARPIEGSVFMSDRGLISGADLPAECIWIATDIRSDARQPSLAGRHDDEARSLLAHSFGLTTHAAIAPQVWRLLAPSPTAAAAVAGAIEGSTGQPITPAARPRPDTTPPLTGLLRVGSNLVRWFALGLSVREQAAFEYSVAGMQTPARRRARHFLYIEGRGGQFRMALSLDGYGFSVADCNTFAGAMDRLNSWAAVEMLRAERHFMRVQGTAVGRGRRCICLIGRRNSGKSTIALHLLMRHHLALLGDDFCLVDPVTSAFVPYPKSLFLRGDAAAFVPELSEHGVAFSHAEPFWLVNVQREFGARPRTADAGLIVWCERDPALRETVVVEPLAQDALHDLLATSLAAPSFDRYQALRLRFADSRSAAAALAVRFFAPAKRRG